MSRTSHGNKHRKDLLAAALFLLPNLIGFLFFTAWPVLLSLFMSFTNWSLKPAVELEWVGLRNYADMVADGDFWFYLYNTMYFMLAIPFTVAGSLFLANALVDKMKIKRARLRLPLAGLLLMSGVLSSVLIFSTGRRDMALILGVLSVVGVCGVLWGNTTYRTMFYIPSFASGVATIILWAEIFNPHRGLMNNILGSIAEAGGLEVVLPTWLNSTKSMLGFIPLPAHFSSSGFGLGAREAIMIMAFWLAIGGNNMILYIAAISNIPNDIFEAAEIDGAGAVRKFRHITIPQVAPTTFFISIMMIIAGFQGGFNFARVMTEGGPAGSTTTLAYYIYTAGFEELEFGYASAVAWVMFTIIFGFTMINWKYGNKVPSY